MRNIIKHPFINLIFFVALFAFSGCTNEMEPDIAGNSNLPADGTPLTVRAPARGSSACAKTHLALNTYQRTSTTSR